MTSFEYLAVVFVRLYCLQNPKAISGRPVIICDGSGLFASLEAWRIPFEKIGQYESGKLRVYTALKRAFVRPETAIFAFYAGVTCFMTYPAVTLTARTYAEKRDPLGVLWVFWRYKYSFAHHLPVSPMRLIAVPEGYSMSVYKIDPLFNLLARIGSIITNETVTYNLILLVSFFLAAVGAYFLVRRLTSSRAAATFAGLAFGFCPYMLAQGKEHLGLAATFWLPFFALLLVKAWHGRSGWSVAGCGMLLAVMALFNYQYGMLAVVFGVTFLVTVWLAGAPWRRTTVNWGVVFKASAVIIVIAVIAAVSLVALTRATAKQDKPIEGLYQFSARPWDYVLPSPESKVFGGITAGFVNSHLHDGFLVENSLFLGYTTMLLAIFALLVSFHSRGRGIPTPGEGGEEPDAPDETRSSRRLSDDPYARRAVLAFAVSAAVAFVFSMPPSAKVLGIRMYFPSNLLYKVLPQFRAYARFGIIVMLCAVVLAGFGIAFLAERLKNPGGAFVLVAVAMMLVLVEFTISPPFFSLDTASTTDYYKWLKKEPGSAAVAVYPLYIHDDFYNYGYLFAQRLHQKDLVNGAHPDTVAAKFREGILDIKHPATAGLLSRAGAKYVVVIPGYYTEGVVHPTYVYATNLDERPMPPGLRAVRSFPDATIYEVTAAPADFVCEYDSGVFEPYVDAQGRAWHPCINETLASIRSYLDKPATCSIRLQVMSAGPTRDVSFSVNGEKKSVAAVPSSPVDVVLEDVVLSPGVNTLKIESDGSPVYLGEVTDYAQVKACIMTSDITVERKL